MTITTIGIIIALSTVFTMAWDAIGVYPAPTVPDHKKLVEA